MPHFFISYAKKDTRGLALQLEAALNALPNVTAWVDKSLRVGQSWEIQIQTEIDRCDYMIVLYSPDINRHKRGEEISYLLNEITYAKYTAHKPIIPVMAQKTEPPLTLTMVHYFDFTQPGIQFTDLITAICLEAGIEQSNISKLVPILEARPSLFSQESFDDQEDVLYEEAVDMVRRLGKASISLLQRRLRLGYTRSAILIDRMEKEGVIGPPVEGAKPREVLPFSPIPTPTPAPILTSTPPPDNTIDWSPVLDSFFRSLALNEPFPGTRMTDDKGIEMVYVPAGKFLMGADDISDREKPVHEVQIAKPFWLDLTPVTNADYARFVKEGGYKTESYWTKSGWNWLQENKITAPKDYDGFTDPRQPRVGVFWYEVCAYSAWRGGRLPTEAEWEWAARGPENRIYPWGDTFDASRLIYSDNSLNKTAVVGSGIRESGASWIGALDMSGNAWEWTNSLYRPYPYQVNDGRDDQTVDGARVLRGGSWRGAQFYARSAFRLSYHPDNRSFSFGFRLLRPPSL